MKYFLHYFFISFLILVLFSCSDKNNEEPYNDQNDRKVKRTLLIYAIASNSLSSNLEMDMKEMQDVGAQLDLENYRLFVYSVQLDPKTGYSMMPKLQQLEKTSRGYNFKTIKEYDNEYRSTDKNRIRKVFQDVQTLSPSQYYGLVLWSHSDAWLPSPNWTALIPQHQSFGQDKDNVQSHYCEIDDLAESIPVELFDFIWFDSCYMANIESLYEFSGKTDYIVGSVTELTSYGMPYDLTLPKLLVEKPNLVEIARLETDYYISTSTPITMTVVDMSKIEKLASATADCYKNFKYLDNSVWLQVYSRRISPALYDFGQYTRELVKQNYADNSSQDSLLVQFTQLLDEFVLYKGHSNLNFSGNVIVESNYSGLSCHKLTNSESKGESFYKSLKWYNRVYKNQ